MPSSAGHVNHLHLVVVDLGRSVAFYTQGLGFEECYTSAGGVVFLRSPAHDSLALEEATSDRRPGMDHFGFALSDADGLGVLVDKVAATGGGVLDRDELAPGHPQALVTDPDGHVIRLRPG
jgi:catechol 2,3-dioxygenase-like lactoylglutathione lyase family enzyme